MNPGLVMMAVGAVMAAWALGSAYLNRGRHAEMAIMVEILAFGAGAFALLIGAVIAIVWGAAS